MNGIKIIIMVIGFALTYCGLAAEENNEPISVEIKAYKVTISESEDGEELLTRVDEVKPGEVIEYQAVYTNTTGKDIVNILATVPIPTNTTYIDESARPGNASASLDGVKFDTIPLKQKVTSEDGKVEERLVPPADYRFTRWTIKKLGAGKEKVFKVRVKINI